MFKRLMTSSLLGLLALPLLAADLKDFPSGTKWVLNLDMKAAQASPILNYLSEKIAPAKRQEVQNKLATALLSGNVRDGDTVRVDVSVDGSGLVLTTEN